MKKRLITGIILGTISLTALIIGMTPLFWGLLIFASLINYELLTINSHTKSSVLVKGFSLILLPVLFVSSILLSDYILEMAVFFAAIHLLLVLELRHGQVIGANSSLFFMLRSIYLSLTISGLFFIRHMENGLVIVLLILSCIWITDSMAYFGGRLIGKRSFSQFSPNKTIEGSTIGLISTVIYAIAFSFILDWPLLLLAAFGLIVSIISQLGDLHESMTKRFFNVKDSSNFLPGHGGFYDRLDSTIAVTPFAIIFLELLL